jgi:hypothetical protein
MGSLYCTLLRALHVVVADQAHVVPGLVPAVHLGLSCIYTTAQVVHGHQDLSLATPLHRPAACNSMQVQCLTSSWLQPTMTLLISDAPDLCRSCGASCWPRCKRRATRNAERLRWRLPGTPPLPSARWQHIDRMLLYGIVQPESVRRVRARSAGLHARVTGPSRHRVRLGMYGMMATFSAGLCSQVQ